MRIAIGVDFNGCNYRGWQTQQTGVRSVQETLEQAIARVANHPVTVHGAGRTDAGDPRARAARQNAEKTRNDEPLLLMTVQGSCSK